VHGNHDYNYSFLSQDSYLKSLPPAGFVLKMLDDLRASDMTLTSFYVTCW
jgi:hypothetical protein